MNVPVRRHSDKPLKSLVSMAHKEIIFVCTVFLSFTLCVQRMLDHTSRCKSGHGNRQ